MRATISTTKKTIYKSKLSRYKSLKSKNAAFAKLSDEDKRKEIAWDALQLVIGGGVGASRGSYWNRTLQKAVWDVSSTDTNMKDSVRTAQQLQEVLLNPPQCAVCARGLMMLSTIRVSDSLEPGTQGKYSSFISPNDGIVNGTDTTLKGKGFSIESFLRMEEEYERSAYEHPYGARTKQKLANICLNVVTNGDFDINDDTDYLKLHGIVLTKKERTKND